MKFKLSIEKTIRNISFLMVVCIFVNIFYYGDIKVSKKYNSDSKIEDTISI